MHRCHGTGIKNTQLATKPNTVIVIFKYCSFYLNYILVLSHVRVSATLIAFDHDLFGYSVITTVIHFTNVQHINQKLVFWYHFTFDCSGPFLSRVFFKRMLCRLERKHLL
jgi:hypothetical protein